MIKVTYFTNKPNNGEHPEMSRADFSSGLGCRVLFRNEGIVNLFELIRKSFKPVNFVLCAICETGRIENFDVRSQGLVHDFNGAVRTTRQVVQ